MKYCEEYCYFPLHTAVQANPFLWGFFRTALGVNVLPLREIIQLCREIQSLEVKFLHGTKKDTKKEKLMKVNSFV